MAVNEKRYIQLWADSFSEGEWLLNNLIYKYFRDEYEINYRYNFQPIYKINNADINLIIEICGDYNSWITLPTPLNEILQYGKPDAIIYDPENEKILFSMEETAAVPTGNQSLQRLERVWFSSFKKIPFIYLIGEYGLHKDGGARRSSIWPVYLALKLTSQYQIPSFTLFYGSADSPENYSVGNGVDVLADLFYIYLFEWLGFDVKDKKNKLYKLMLKDMCDFVIDQSEEISKMLPGKDVMNDTFIEFLLERIT